MINNETKQKLVTELEKPFYSIYETADILGVHHKTIRNHINNGTLKAGKSGQQWRIAKEDIMKYLNDAGATISARKDIALTKSDLKLLLELVNYQIEFITAPDMVITEIKDAEHEANKLAKLKKKLVAGLEN